LFQTNTHPQTKEIIMFMTKTVCAVIATISTVSINAYAADRQTNPLHPAYFADTVEFAASEGARYVDSGNLLHPAFARNGSAGDWIATGKGDGKPYADTRNPLHPAYSKS
jgi:ribosomal protein L31